MPFNVFGNSNSNNSDNKFDTSLFVQKPYLRTNYIESNIEEDIDLKNQYRIKNVPDPLSITEACNKNYVDTLFNDSSIIKNNKDNDFGNYNLSNINSITLNKEAENDNEVITKTYVDQFHNDNERNRRDLGLSFYNESGDLVKNNQDNDLNDNKLTNIKSITINSNPTDDNHVSNEKYIDDEVDKNTIVRFNQTLSNYLKVSVGNDIYNLTKYDKISITDVTEIKFPNRGSQLLQKWNIYGNKKIYQSRIFDFIRSSKTGSPTDNSGAINTPPIGTAFMYIETSGNNNGDNVYIILERTDIIQISNITFYFNRYSISDPEYRAMGRFRIKLLLEDNIWTTQYTLEINTQFSESASEWKLLNLNFTQENYGIRLIYDRIDSAHADMCFSNITITHSVY